MKDFLYLIYGAMVLPIGPMELQFESYTSYSKTKEKFIRTLPLGKKKLCESATRKGSGRIQRSYDTRGKTGRMAILSTEENAQS